MSRWTYRQFQEGRQLAESTTLLSPVIYAKISFSTHPEAVLRAVYGCFLYIKSFFSAPGSFKERNWQVQLLQAFQAYLVCLMAIVACIWSGIFRCTPLHGERNRREEAILCSPSRSQVRSSVILEIEGAGERAAQENHLAGVANRRHPFSEPNLYARSEKAKRQAEGFLDDGSSQEGGVASSPALSSPVFDSSGGGSPSNLLQEGDGGDLAPRDLSFRWGDFPEPLDGIDWQIPSPLARSISSEDNTPRKKAEKAVLVSPRDNKEALKDGSSSPFSDFEIPSPVSGQERGDLADEPLSDSNDEFGWEKVALSPSLETQVVQILSEKDRASAPLETVICQTIATQPLTLASDKEQQGTLTVLPTKSAALAREEAPLPNREEAKEEADQKTREDEWAGIELLNEEQKQEAQKLAPSRLREMLVRAKKTLHLS